MKYMQGLFFVRHIYVNIAALAFRIYKQARDVLITRYNSAI
jgi:hypothetical protein